MGATISSLEVQSFHPNDPAFKVNTSLLPAQPAQPRTNVPRRSPSGLVKGKPLIFSAMSPEPEQNAPAPMQSRNAYPSPMEPSRSPPPLRVPLQPAQDQYEPFDPGFSQNVLQGLDWSEQPSRTNGRVPPASPPPGLRPQPPVTPRVNGNTPLPSHGAPQPPQLPPSLQTQLPIPIPQSPSRVNRSPVQRVPAHSPSLPSLSSPSRPVAPPSPVQHRMLTKPRPGTPQRKQSAPALQQPTPVEEPSARAQIPVRASTLMLEDDPFAKVDPIRMLKPSASTAEMDAPSTSSLSDTLLASPTTTQTDEMTMTDRPRTPEVSDEFIEPVTVTPTKTRSPPSPVTPEDYRAARSERRGNQLSKAPPAQIAGVETRDWTMPGPFPFVRFILNPQLLAPLLDYLSFYDWCVLSAVTKDVRGKLVGTKLLREVALERYLRTDLHDYMRGVTLPSHEHARIADEYVQSFNPPACCTRSNHSGDRAESYHAEREASEAATLRASLPPSSSKKRRPPSPTSLYSAGGAYSGSHAQLPISASGGALTFRSTLFRLRRAPLLRVFVPSPDGDWLSDKSVLECEAELKRAGVLKLLRAGDVVWDIAVGDEGNVGRLVWDGSYLIDLDYKYSPVGDLPQYLPTLAFPPSYFHRVIRTGANSSNPVAHIDVSPWGLEIAANLQLLQDRIRTETPQGNVHNVVRWVHRSSFVIRAPNKARMSMSSNRAQPLSPASASAKIPIPDAPGFFVNPGWYGTIVVETEGTNEALADLQDRCPGAFPPRAGGPVAVTKEQKDVKKVWRILREKSQPSEIWIRAVSPKERLF
ncbi:hypothetical protein MKEN_00513100 [Mycena kentingensis (nom. inval.)]|nr:hypothetical protein MKEN_00513100 [Mycena kentingensis (nom. inval.)]